MSNLYTETQLDLIRDAAPEMYEALKGIIPWLEEVEDRHLVGDEGCHWPVEFVRAAISKAEGKQS